MPIQFACENCQQNLKVPDSAAGKRGRCNACGHLNMIPAVAATVETAASNTSAVEATPVAEPAANTLDPGKFNVKSAVNGGVFGPADSATLKEWFDEGRITPNCQLQRVGTQQWTPASEMAQVLGGVVGSVGATGASVDPFSQFQQTVTAQPNTGELNPYAPTLSPQKLVGPKVSSEIVTTTGDIGFCISHGWKVWTENFGLLLASILTMGVPIFATVLFTIRTETIGDKGTRLAAVLGLFIVSQLIQTWLTLGLVKMVCQLCRGQRAEYATLFSRGSRMPLAVLLYMPFYLLGAVSQITEQFIVDPDEILRFSMIISGISLALSLFIWPIYHLLADTDLGLECVTKGLSIGLRNCLLSIPIFFVAGLIGMSGILACLIGIIATLPAIHTIIATAYLNMSGQLSPR